jgi:hypothetical protein
MPNRQVRPGDVVEIRLEGRVGLAHVLADYKQGWQFMAFFGPFQEVPSDLETAVQRKPALVGISTDARVRSGDWHTIGHAQPNDEYLPAYQVSMGRIDNVLVEDYTGNRSRPATAQERRELPHRGFSAPMVFEKALRSLAGLEPWHEAFDNLRPAEGCTSKSLFGPLQPHSA